MSTVALPLIRHALFDAAREDLFDVVSTADSGSLVRFIGLSGTGKSEIALLVMRKLAGPPKYWGLGIPAMLTRAVKAEQSRFSSKHLTARLLAGMYEPDIRWAIDNKISGTPEAIAIAEAARDSTEFWKSVRQAKSETNMLDAFIKSATLRQLKFIFIEESHAMCAVKKNIKPADYMQSLMSLASDIKCVIVFLGTPRMKALWTDEGELRRRTRTVYLNRYRVDNEVHRSEFARLVRTLAQRYPLAGGELSDVSVESLYYGSFGIVGEIKAHLNRAKQISRQRSRQTIDEEDIGRALYGEQELRELAAEAAFFDLSSQGGSLSQAKKIYHALEQLGRSSSR